MKIEHIRLERGDGLRVSLDGGGDIQIYAYWRVWVTGEHIEIVPSDSTRERMLDIKPEQKGAKTDES